jgi:hypothetical protein
MRSPTEWSRPAQFAAAFGLVVAVGVLFGAATSSTAFGAYNHAWDGTSDLRSVADSSAEETHLAQTSDEYADTPPEATVAVIVAPDRSYRPRELLRIEQFVRQGGTLVVADELTQPSNELLAGIGAEARINGTPLRDEQVYHGSPAAPVARNLSDDPVVADVRALTLNYGTSVDPGNASVLARTSGYAYLDANRSGKLDDSETLGEYPVATAERVGEGRVIVVGDASVFINDMLDRSGNQQFAHNLLGTREHAVLDYSHTASLPPLVRAALFLRDRPVVQLLVGVLGVFALAGLASRRSWVRSAVARFPGRRSPSTADLPESADGSLVSEEDLIAQLRARRPEWDDERLRRVVSARRNDSDDRK